MKKSSNYVATQIKQARPKYANSLFWNSITLPQRCRLHLILTWYHKKSLILSSQLAVADWYGIFSNEMLAEACLDRVAHKSLRFDLKGDSMRKKY